MAAINFIEDEQRHSYLATIHSRILKGKSTLLIGKCGSGKTALLKNITLPSFTVIPIESLGSPNYILTSILLKSKYNFTARPHKSVEYLTAILNIPKIAILLDDINDLRPGFFRFLKRMMDAGIPLVMAGTPEITTLLKQNHEDVLARLRILHLTPLSILDFKDNYAQFEKDTLELISGFSFGNMWIFKEICEEGLEKLKESSLTKVTVNLVHQIIQKYQSLSL